MLAFVGACGGWWGVVVVSGDCVYSRFTYIP